MGGVELAGAAATREMTLLGINTAAQAAGFLAPGVRLESLDTGGLGRLRGGIRAKRTELDVAGLSRPSHEVLSHLAAGHDVDPEDLLVALRVVERSHMDVGPVSL